MLCRLVGARLITIYVVGRKSGRHYAVPVAFTRHDGVLLVGTPFGWGRNLRTGEAVDIRLKGKRRRMDVVVVTDEDAVVENYAVMARRNRQFAKFNKISLDQAGEPKRRVGLPHYCGSPPSEPCVRRQSHTAQASPLGVLADGSSGLLAAAACRRWQ